MKLPHIPYTPTNSLACLLDIYPRLTLDKALTLLLRADSGYMARMTEERRQMRETLRREMQEART